MEFFFLSFQQATSSFLYRVLPGKQLYLLLTLVCYIGSHVKLARLAYQSGYEYQLTANSDLQRWIEPQFSS